MCRGRGIAWGLAALLGGGGCDQPTVEEPASGGLVALSRSGEAVILGAGSRLVTDLAQANASVRVGAGADIAGPLAVNGDLVLEPGARVTGQVTIAGRVRGGSVMGMAVSARSPWRTLPPLGEVAVNLPWWGEDGPALVLAPGEERRLAGGGRSLVPELVLGAGARLVLDGVALTVRQRLALGPRAQVVVRGSGRLLIIATVELRIDEGASLVQEGQDLARGLIAMADRAASVRWAGQVAFGPGLLYAPEVDLRLGVESSGGSFRGAVVGRRVVVGAGADLVLNRRPLSCLLDRDCPSVDLGPGPQVIDRDPSATQASLSATVTDVGGGAEALVLWDAAGQREMPLAGPGALALAVGLRSDGQPTLVCASARDCADHLSEESCRLYRVPEEVDFDIDRPKAGAVVQGNSVRISGTIRRGRAAAVEGAGRAGVAGGDLFWINDVPLVPGINRIVVRVTGAQGGISERRLLVGSGSLPVMPIDVAWRAGYEGARAAGASRRGPVRAATFDLADGNDSYRLLDESGRELYRGGFDTHGLPQPARAAAIVVEDSCAPSYGEDQGQDTIFVPALDDARTIEFFRGRSWDRVGRAALAEIPPGP